MISKENTYSQEVDKEELANFAESFKVPVELTAEIVQRMRAPGQR